MSSRHLDDLYFRLIDASYGRMELAVAKQAALCEGALRRHTTEQLVKVGLILQVSKPISFTGLAQAFINLLGKLPPEERKSIEKRLQ